MCLNSKTLDTDSVTECDFNKYHSTDSDSDSPPRVSTYPSRGNIELAPKPALGIADPDPFRGQSRSPYRILTDRAFPLRPEREGREREMGERRGGGGERGRGRDGEEGRKREKWSMTGVGAM
jgi:hypothetical protein